MTTTPPAFRFEPLTERHWCGAMLPTETPGRLTVCGKPADWLASRFEVAWDGARRWVPSAFVCGACKAAMEGDG